MKYKQYLTDFLLPLLPIIFGFLTFAFQEVDDDFFKGGITAGIIIIIIVFIVVVIFHIKKQHNIGELRKKIAIYEKRNAWLIDNAKHICESRLANLADKQLEFGMSNKKNSERMTLYSYNPEKFYFTAIGRYSKNQTFMKMGRMRYTENEGVIGEAWKNTACFKQLTEYDTDKNRWLEEQTEMNLDTNTCEKFNMKSALYFAHTIMREDKNSANGIIVVESTERDRYEEDALEKAIKNKLEDFYDLIDILKPYLGELDEGRKRGY